MGLDFAVHPPKPRKRKLKSIEVVLTDPHSERKEGPKVTMRRITYKEVPEYEAEILLRHGWERVDDEEGVNIT